LEEVQGELENPDIWNDPEKAQRLGKDRARLEGIVNTVVKLDDGLVEARDLLELARDEDDTETVGVVESDIAGLDKHLAELEFRRMFSGELDASNAFLDIQSGSGGTEAQDWAEMLLRMYLRWGERRGFKTEIIEASSGEVAGIKSTTVRFEGEYA
jgi:peptide chain release factor 2